MAIVQLYHLLQIIQFWQRTLRLGCKERRWIEKKKFQVVCPICCHNRKFHAVIFERMARNCSPFDARTTRDLLYLILFFFSSITLGGILFVCIHSAITIDSYKSCQKDWQAWLIHFYKLWKLRKMVPRRKSQIQVLIVVITSKISNSLILWPPRSSPLALDRVKFVSVMSAPTEALIWQKKEG